MQARGPSPQCSRSARRAAAGGHEIATAHGGREALAVTDHDGFYGVVRFAEAARAVGLPTVFGVELTLDGPVAPPVGEPDPPGEHLVLLARDPSTGEWGQPVFYNLGGASVGLQIGGERSEVVLLLQSQDALDSFLSPKLQLGAGAREQRRATEDDGRLRAKW